MTEKILFVDDEPNVLAGLERQLRKRYTIETAPGGAEGLSRARHARDRSRSSCPTCGCPAWTV